MFVVSFLVFNIFATFLRLGVAERASSTSSKCAVKHEWTTLNQKTVVDAWKLRKGDVVVRTCSSCAASHRTIVYKRLTAPGSIDYRALFLDTWASAPKGGSNVLNIDFALYGSVADAQVPPLACLFVCVFVCPQYSCGNKATHERTAVT